MLDVKFDFCLAAKFMGNLRTICVDKYGMEMTEELKPFADKYLDKIRELAKEFVNEYVDQDIENGSAYGMFLSMVMGELTMAYGKRCLRDLNQKHQRNVAFK